MLSIYGRYEHSMSISHIRIMIMLYVYITLACDIFKVEYIKADFKAVFFTLNPKIKLIFSNQIKFLGYKLLLEMYSIVS